MYKTLKDASNDFKCTLLEFLSKCLQGRFTVKMSCILIKTIMSDTCV